MVNGTALGIRVLEARGFFTEPYWYWIGVGANIGFLVLFNIMFTVFLTYLKRELSPFSWPKSLQ